MDLLISKKHCPPGIKISQGPAPFLPSKFRIVQWRCRASGQGDAPCASFCLVKTKDLSRRLAGSPASGPECPQCSPSPQHGNVSTLTTNMGMKPTPFITTFLSSATSSRVSLSEKQRKISLNIQSLQAKMAEFHMVVRDSVQSESNYPILWRVNLSL